MSDEYMFSLPDNRRFDSRSVDDRLADDVEEELMPRG